MFKIGNSKDLPDIPNHLSEEGKDFVRKCLQRNPANRPTAAKLLEHAFVKNVMPLERPLVIAESAESMNVASSTMRSLVLQISLVFLNPCASGYLTNLCLFLGHWTHKEPPVRLGRYKQLPAERIKTWLGIQVPY